MNEVHLHLMMNHLPVVGTFFAVMLLAWAVIKRSDDLKRAAFGAIVIVGAFSIPTFRSGDSAQMMIGDLPGVTDEIIAQHEAAAKIACPFAIGVGVFALLGLVLFLKKPVTQIYALVLLLLALGLAGVMGWTANLGGKIRHTEIRDVNDATKDSKPDQATGDTVRAK